MPAPRVRETPPATAYIYRRRLAPRERLPALAVGLCGGVAAAYVAWLYLQRTPLDISGTARTHLSRGPSDD